MTQKCVCVAVSLCGSGSASEYEGAERHHSQTSFCLEETEVLWLQLDLFTTVPLTTHNKICLVNCGNVTEQVSAVIT